MILSVCVFTLNKQRQVLQQEARLAGGSREHRVHWQPQKGQEV